MLFQDHPGIGRIWFLVVGPLTLSGQAASFHRSSQPGSLLPPLRPAGDCLSAVPPSFRGFTYTRSTRGEITFNDLSPRRKDLSNFHISVYKIKNQGDSNLLLALQEG